LQPTSVIAGWFDEEFISIDLSYDPINSESISTDLNLMAPFVFDRNSLRKTEAMENHDPVNHGNIL
jgi:hypothetical protein